MTVTAEWQFEFNGLLMGDATDYDVVEVTGLDLPAFRTGDIPSAQDHGSYPTPDRLDVRDVILTVEMVAASSSALNTLVTALAAATAPDSTTRTLVFRLPGQSNRQINCRARGRSHPIGWQYVVGNSQQVQVRFVAHDPRIYASTATTTVINPGGAGSVGNGLGTFPAPFVVRFNGPVTNPTLTAGGRVTSIAGTIASGDWVQIDTLRRTVVTNTGSDYYGNVSSFDFVQVPVGSVSVSFTGSSTTGATNATFTVRETHV